jgi:hypothetical protein
MSSKPQSTQYTRNKLPQAGISRKHQNKLRHLKLVTDGRHQGLMPVILANQEAEIRRIGV